MDPECIQCLVCLHRFQNVQSLAAHVQEFQSKIIHVLEQIHDVASGERSHDFGSAASLSRLRNLVEHQDMPPHESVNGNRHQESINGEQCRAGSLSPFQEVNHAADLSKLADGDSQKCKQEFKCPHEDCKDTVSRRQDLLRHYALHIEYDEPKTCLPCGMACSDAKKLLYHKCTGHKSRKRSFKPEREKMRISAIKELNSKLQAGKHDTNTFSSPSWAKSEIQRDCIVNEAAAEFSAGMTDQEGMIWQSVDSQFAPTISPLQQANSIGPGGLNTTNLSAYDPGLARVYYTQILDGQEAIPSDSATIYTTLQQTAIEGQGIYSAFDGIQQSQNQINDF